MYETCVRCRQCHPCGHRDPTNHGLWYCEDCWVRSVGYQRVCNACKRRCSHGTVSYTDQHWYCNECWARRDANLYASGHGLPPHAHVPLRVASGRNSDRSIRDRSASPATVAERRARKRPRQDQPPKNKEALLSPDKDPTTLMLRNLPTTLTRDMLMELLEEEGYGLKIDFVYVPMSFAGAKNFGYGFVNFISHEEAENCRAHMQGFSRWPVTWHQSCEVRTGDTAQGVDEHIQRYRNSPVMHESVPEAHKPAIFENGIRKPFPAPTTTLKRPKQRNKKSKEGQDAQAPQEDAEDPDCLLGP